MDGLTEEQKKFYDFVLKSAQAGKEEEAASIMNEALLKLQTGEFTKESMTDIGMRVMAIIRFECIAEFLQTVQKFGDLIK